MPRKRALCVCAPCHERKVRCDRDETNGTCSNCIERRLECTLRSRKRYSTANRRSRSTAVQSIKPADRVTSPASEADINSIINSVIKNPSSRSRTIYVGDGGYGAILDVIGETDRRHFSAHGSQETALAPEDLEYLKLKGCFDLPSDSEELLTAYFHFLHPIFPAINGPAFLDDYETRGLDRINLLLIWSMFSVSISFTQTPCDLQRKSSFVQRAKLLFELGGVRDKLVLIRSALLLSFWFDDGEDVKQSWYWSGIAFSIAQTLGLHRYPGPDRHLGEEQDYAAWDNLWRCCCLRDVWQSCTMGRPLRLQVVPSEDHSRPVEECRFRQMNCLKLDRVYTNEEAGALEKMWRSLTIISNELRQALSLASTILPARPMQDLSTITLDTEVQDSPILTSCKRHLLLCHNAARLIIFQQSGKTDTLISDEAAGQIDVVVQAYLASNTCVYAPPTAIALIMPAMVTDLAYLKDSSKKEIGVRRLERCFTFCDAIAGTYPAADMVKRMFVAATTAVGASEFEFMDARKYSTGFQDGLRLLRMPLVAQHYST